MIGLRDEFDQAHDGPGIVDQQFDHMGAHNFAVVRRHRLGQAPQDRDPFAIGKMGHGLDQGRIQHACALEFQESQFRSRPIDRAPKAPVMKINATGAAMHPYCQCMGEVSTSATP